MPPLLQSAVRSGTGFTRGSVIAIVALVTVISLIAGFMVGNMDCNSALSSSLLLPNIPSGASLVRSLSLGGITSKPKPVQPVCSNTCFKAKNGYCDEGRGPLPTLHDQYTSVFCDLGTDCDDCGPWYPSAAVKWTSDLEGPVHMLLKKGVDIRTKNTSLPIPFSFAFTDPKKDVDVSREVQAGGILEPMISEVFYKIFKEGCVSKTGNRALFADVGANFGWFTVLAAALGCRVIAFEPVPHFRAFLEYNVHVNGLAHLVDIRSYLVSDISGQKQEMVVPDAGIWGTAGIGGINIDKNIKSNNIKLSIMSHRLEDVVKEDVLLLKVDVEGFEWAVMAGAMKLLTNYNVANIAMEYSPGATERSLNHTMNIATPQMLVDILSSGYRIGHMENKMKSAGWEGPATPIEEVLLGNVKYDVEDAQRRRDGTLGCPLPESIKKEFYPCGSIPEDQNPRSFRSAIGHNTNIWAAKEGGLLRLEGVTGIFDLNDPAYKYFVTNKDMKGSARRICDHLLPAVQVRHRCPCRDKAACGDLETRVAKLASLGNIPSSYVLP